MKMKSAFGKIVGRDKLDAKSVTPPSEQNAAWAKNRPKSREAVPQTFRDGFLDMRVEKRAEHILAARRKRGE